MARITLLICALLYSLPLYSQEYSELQVPNYTKIVTKNITNEECNISHKNSYEVLFWNNENSLVEFFYTSQNEVEGLRIVANSDGSYTMEVKSIVNLQEVDSLTQALYPHERPQITNMTVEKRAKMLEEKEAANAKREKYRLDSYKISTNSVEVSEAFVNQIEKVVMAILTDKKYNPTRNYITMDGEMATLHYTDGDDIVSIITLNPETHLKEVVDIFVEMSADVRKNDFAPSEHFQLFALH